MSIKTFFQILILILLLSIVSAVYIKYFQTGKNIVEEINTLEIDNEDRIIELEKKISDLEIQNNKLNKEIQNNKISINSSISETEISKDINEIDSKRNELNIKSSAIEENKIEISTQKNETKKKEIKNLVKDVEYTSVDQRGNRFYLLANSGKSNINNVNILDLINVRGEITSDTRDTIYIVSDFAQYNSVNLNSKFYKNVIINYQDKEITCLNFDINMETNKAIAYNNVLIVDPKSNMKAGLVEFDLKTKNIDIRPENDMKDIKVTSN